MAVRTLPMPWTTIVVRSTTAKFFPCTPYVDPNTAKKARVTIEGVEIIGDPKVKAAYQQANSESDPEDHVAFGDPLTATGILYPTGWTTLSGSDAAQLSRFGFEACTESTTDVSIIRVCGKVEISDS